MISPTASGINGHVKDSVTNQPLSAKISLQIEGEPAFEIICDTDGNFRERLAQDTYTVTASMTGYISKPIVVIIEDGYRGVEIELEREVASQ